MRNHVRGAIALSATALMLAAATPVAAAPSSERIPIDIEFSDGFLSAECGVDVVTSITGFRITLTVTGQVPFEFVGALVFDFDAGIVVKEPQFRGEEQLAKVCRLLSDD